MAVRMDPVILRRKIMEIENTIAEMKQQGAAEELIRIEERKRMVLRKWLEQAEETKE